MTRTPVRPFRSRDWFAAPGRSDMTALYLERFMNYGITPDELRCGKPIIGIAQSGSDLTPCNRIHLELAERVRAGIRDAGGIPMEFPVHPIFENCRRPTAALDRNLALSRPGRDPARLSDRRRRPHHRLRQDDAGRDHGRLDRRHSGHHACRAGRCSTAGTKASWSARAR